MLNNFTLGRNSNPRLWRNRCPLTVEDVVPAAFYSAQTGINIKLKARRVAVGGDPVFHSNVSVLVCARFTQKLQRDLILSVCFYFNNM